MIKRNTETQQSKQTKVSERGSVTTKARKQNKKTKQRSWRWFCPGWWSARGSCLSVRHPEASAPASQGDVLAGAGPGRAGPQRLAAHCQVPSPHKTGQRGGDPGLSGHAHPGAPPILPAQEAQGYPHGMCAQRLGRPQAAATLPWEHQPAALITIQFYEKTDQAPGLSVSKPVY